MIGLYRIIKLIWFHMHVSRNTLDSFSRRVLYNYGKSNREIIYIPQYSWDRKICRVYIYYAVISVQMFVKWILSCISSIKIEFPSGFSEARCNSPKAYNCYLKNTSWPFYLAVLKHDCLFPRISQYEWCAIVREIWRQSISNRIKWKIHCFKLSIWHFLRPITLSFSSKRSRHLTSRRFSLRIQ